MCGVAGFWQPGGFAQDAAQATALAMGHKIAHRGPDDAGVWVDAQAGIALAHRRLSILELSAAGHQPMISASGRYVLAFNGEIYNHQQLRAELAAAAQAPEWRGGSDTETLLAGFDAWGLPACVTRATGMFAMAVWDRRAHTLTLVRDRVGEKPLYYGWQKGVFLFGSELKALRVHPAFSAGIDRHALALLMRHNYIQAPHTIYQGLHKLLPGCWLTVPAPDERPQPQRYWDACQVVEQGLAAPFQGTPEEAVDTLEAELKRAIGQQMVADVPLGAFLSGGVDSSTIVALMQAQSSRPVKTFTIGFDEAAYNEATHAKAVARHLGTDHTELYVTPQQALEVIPRLPEIYCEPFADSSQIPTHLVSQLARQHVTVSLSGDAGDELFGGYGRYFLADGLHRKLSMLPGPLRAALSRMISGISVEGWNRFLAPVKPLLPLGLSHAGANVGDKLHKGAELLGARTTAQLYRGLVTHWPHPAKLVLDSAEPATVLMDQSSQPKTDAFIHQMMALDLLTYLPDDILAKVDRAAMAVSLETRVPLLDHRVVEFAWQLPLHYKVREGVGKWPLRQVLYRHIPQALIERPKMGFSVPIGSWLCGPLRDWAESLLDESRLRQEGFFNPVPIRQKWAEHLSGKRNWQYHLWDVLMFQAWLAEHA